MALSGSGAKYFYLLSAFLLEIITTFAALLSFYAIIKIVKEDKLENSFFIVILVTFLCLIISSIWIQEILVKENQVIRTLIVIDTFVVVTSVSLIVIATFTSTQFMSFIFITHFFELLRSLNTAIVFKTILNHIEKFFSCCRVPSIVSFTRIIDF